MPYWLWDLMMLVLISMTSLMTRDLLALATVGEYLVMSLILIGLWMEPLYRLEEGEREYFREEYSNNLHSLDMFWVF